ncbi:hypothetical protein J7E97_20910 [Streptomyces sp. ISL-66]|uniref:hypothetical protein n=1 Tax=Streptomyces sp. ISL-66 TaxID=2819186 RepID=UPI001BE7B044|nr:hypothetical protein [Streptomyces sp. ISL-66]MBT2470266.1 hypothetical protein [Streptomyces sp. ISL-66]
MTDVGIDLDALPPDTLAAWNGQITPIGELIIARVAKDLTAICKQSHDPQAAFDVLRESIPKQMREIANQRPTSELSPLRTALTGLAGSQCLQRRPDRDPLTGDRLFGRPDTDDTFADRLPCTRQHSHNGDHRDALARAWQRTEHST